MNTTTTTTLRNPIQFMLSGKAIFTVQNSTTGNRFTFRVQKPKSDAPHFVSVLTGSDNENGYTFLGTIFDGATYRHGRRSRISDAAPSAKAFAWLFENLTRGARIPECVKICHCGRCGRCGRLLTVPESVESGFGPECAQLLAA